MSNGNGVIRAGQPTIDRYRSCRVSRPLLIEDPNDVKFKQKGGGRSDDVVNGEENNKVNPKRESPQPAAVEETLEERLEEVALGGEEDENDENVANVKKKDSA